MEHRLRPVRVATLGSFAHAVLTSLAMPGIGLFQEDEPLRIWLGAVGIVLFSIAQAGVLYAAVTPSLSKTVHRRLLWTFGAAAIMSLPLVAPLAAADWETWAWLGASVVGTAPLLAARNTAGAIMVAAVAVSGAVGWWNGGPVADYLLITAGIGLMIVGIVGLQVWMWNLLIAAREGRSAQERLAVTEERLRFARDVHDLLGHTLSVIALKAELAERLASTDAERAGREAGEVRELAASALADLRGTVHGYRTLDLPAQLTATAQVLRASGVRCTVTEHAGALPQEIATPLAMVLREASTNILRHSKASWCTIELVRRDDEVRMIVTNDGATAAEEPDERSSGLNGLRERLAASGGVLRTSLGDGRFRLEATLRGAS